MTTFSFFFGLVLSEKIMRHTDALSRTLQKPSRCTAEEMEVQDLSKTMEEGTGTPPKKMKLVTRRSEVVGQKLVQIKRTEGVGQEELVPLKERRCKLAAWPSARRQRPPSALAPGIQRFGGRDWEK